MYGFFDGVRDDWPQDDVVYLGKMVGRFRRHIGCTTRQAAELIGVPWRTLEYIEQGRGFRYPVMLMNSMIYAAQQHDEKQHKQST